MYIIFTDLSHLYVYTLRKNLILNEKTGRFAVLIVLRGIANDNALHLQTKSYNGNDNSQKTIDRTDEWR